MITSAAEVVLPGVWLSVCLLATSYLHLHENFTRDVSMHKEETITLWRSSTSGSAAKIFEGLEVIQIGLGRACAFRVTSI